MNNVLITRPMPDARNTASLLRARGLETQFAPLLIVERLIEHKDLKQAFDALVVTSKNALRYIPVHFVAQYHRTPIYCVGDATAEMAKHVGFKKIYSAQGDGRDLTDLILSQADGRKKLLRLSRFGPTHDGVVKRLSEKGHDVTSYPVYCVKTAKKFPTLAQQLIQCEGIDHVLLYSPLTAKTFAQLIRRAGLKKQCEGMSAWCISDNTAKALGQLQMASVSVAPEPNEAALLSFFDQQQSVIAA